MSNVVNKKPIYSIERELLDKVIADKTTTVKSVGLDRAKELSSLDILRFTRKRDRLNAKILEYQNAKYQFKFKRKQSLPRRLLSTLTWFILKAFISALLTINVALHNHFTSHHNIFISYIVLFNTTTILLVFVSLTRNIYIQHFSRFKFFDT